MGAPMTAMFVRLAIGVIAIAGGTPDIAFDEEVEQSDRLDHPTFDGSPFEFAKDVPTTSAKPLRLKDAIHKAEIVAHNKAMQERAYKLIKDLNAEDGDAKVTPKPKPVKPVMPQKTVLPKPRVEVASLPKPKPKKNEKMSAAAREMKKKAYEKIAVATKALRNAKSPKEARRARAALEKAMKYVRRKISLQQKMKKQRQAETAAKPSATPPGKLKPKPKPYSHVASFHAVHHEASPSGDMLARLAEGRPDPFGSGSAGGVPRTRASPFAAVLSHGSEQGGGARSATGTSPSVHVKEGARAKTSPFAPVLSHGPAVPAKAKPQQPVPKGTKKSPSATGVPVKPKPAQPVPKGQKKSTTTKGGKGPIPCEGKAGKAGVMQKPVKPCGNPCKACKKNPKAGKALQDSLKKAPRTPVAIPVPVLQPVHTGEGNDNDKMKPKAAKRVALPGKGNDLRKAKQAIREAKRKAKQAKRQEARVKRRIIQRKRRFRKLKKKALDANKAAAKAKNKAKELGTKAARLKCSAASADDKRKAKRLCREAAAECRKRQRIEKRVARLECRAKHQLVAKANAEKDLAKAKQKLLDATTEKERGLHQACGDAKAAKQAEKEDKHLMRRAKREAKRAREAEKMLDAEMKTHAEESAKDLSLAEELKNKAGTIKRRATEKYNHDKLNGKGSGKEYRAAIRSAKSLAAQGEHLLRKADRETRRDIAAKQDHAIQELKEKRASATVSVAEAAAKQSEKMLGKAKRVEACAEIKSDEAKQRGLVKSPEAVMKLKKELSKAKKTLKTAKKAEKQIQQGNALSAKAAALAVAFTKAKAKLGLAKAKVSLAVVSKNNTAAKKDVQKEIKAKSECKKIARVGKGTAKIAKSLVKKGVKSLKKAQKAADHIGTMAKKAIKDGVKAGKIPKHGKQVDTLKANVKAVAKEAEKKRVSPVDAIAHSIKTGEAVLKYLEGETKQGGKGKGKTFKGSSSTSGSAWGRNGMEKLERKLDRKEGNAEKRLKALKEEVERAKKLGDGKDCGKKKGATEQDIASKVALIKHTTKALMRKADILMEKARAYAKLHPLDLKVAIMKDNARKMRAAAKKIAKQAKTVAAGPNQSDKSVQAAKEMFSKTLQAVDAGKRDAKKAKKEVKLLKRTEKMAITKSKAEKFKQEEKREKKKSKQMSRSAKKDIKVALARMKSATTPKQSQSARLLLNKGEGLLKKAKKEESLARKQAKKAQKEKNKELQRSAHKMLKRGSRLMKQADDLKNKAKKIIMEAKAKFAAEPCAKRVKDAKASMVKAAGIMRKEKRMTKRAKELMKKSGRLMTKVAYDEKERKVTSKVMKLAKKAKDAQAKLKTDSAWSAKAGPMPPDKLAEVTEDNAKVLKAKEKFDAFKAKAERKLQKLDAASGNFSKKAAIDLKKVAGMSISLTTDAPPMGSSPKGGASPKMNFKMLKKKGAAKAKPKKARKAKPKKAAKAKPKKGCSAMLKKLKLKPKKRANSRRALSANLAHHKRDIMSEASTKRAEADVKAMASRQKAPLFPTLAPKAGKAVSKPEVKATPTLTPQAWNLSDSSLKHLAMPFTFGNTSHQIKRRPFKVASWKDVAIEGSKGGKTEKKGRTRNAASQVARSGKEKKWKQDTLKDKVYPWDSADYADDSQGGGDVAPADVRTIDFVKKQLRDVAEGDDASFDGVADLSEHSDRFDMHSAEAAHEVADDATHSVKSGSSSTHSKYVDDTADDGLNDYLADSVGGSPVHRHASPKQTNNIELVDADLNVDYSVDDLLRKSAGKTSPADEANLAEAALYSVGSGDGTPGSVDLPLTDEDSSDTGDETDGYTADEALVVNRAVFDGDVDATADKSAVSAHDAANSIGVSDMKHVHSTVAADYAEDDEFQNDGTDKMEDLTDYTTDSADSADT
eukprot:TRINITY_DN11428_c0_g1_i1.p1 TRINITY_DN11428_c0_g1~~TRINITY_DN11428_c0_g1_i1.p1  ORF type:complete len:1895 (+),score=484.40 TRINITY_DN11428_c0_g1_i1:81-5765(+)